VKEGGKKTRVREGKKGWRARGLTEKTGSDAKPKRSTLDGEVQVTGEEKELLKITGEGGKGGSARKGGKVHSEGKNLQMEHMDRGPIVKNRKRVLGLDRWRC